MSPRSFLPGLVVLGLAGAGGALGAGCGGGTVGTGGTPDSGVATAPPTRGSAAPPSTTNVDAGVADAGFLAGGEGFVDIGVTDDSAAPKVTAAFFGAAYMPSYVNGGITQMCEETSPYGTCTLYICPINGAPTLPLPTTISAGPVTVSGSAGSFALDPVSDSSGATYVLSGAASLAPAEAVTIAAPGSTFTSFTAQLDLAPRVDLSAGLPGAVGMTADATVTWKPVTTAGSAGSTTNVVVTFQQVAPNEPTLVCTYPASAGTGTIPEGAWEAFMPGTVTVTAAAVTTASLAEGKAALYLSSSTAAFVAAGSMLDTSIPVN